MEAWQFNLSLIPGIAVILASTNRMVLGLTDEINSRLLSNPDAFAHVLPRKIKQLRRLSISIVLMYIAIVILVSNTLIIALHIIQANQTHVLVLTSISVFFISIYYQLYFALSAYKIRQDQFKTFLNIEKIKK